MLALLSIFVLLIMFDYSKSFYLHNYKRFQTITSYKIENRNDHHLNMALRDDERTIIGYDNVGDPIYKDEMNAKKGGISVLGINIEFDPISASLGIFGLIAFNFFVLANIELPF
mmetsp:Transcript_27855/g.28113  ORF Transcript_27855/g.28113 Transcript_27855/m.28113 type:complete len:114 (+) Transcript_27855:53-394(+)